MRSNRAGWMFLALLLVTGHSAAAAETARVLFLGDNGPHKPAERFAQIQPVLKQRGIEVSYSDRMSDLNPQTLAGYDGLLIYSNEMQISPEQEKALIDYVRAGHGLIPVHCASYCFHNSPKYAQLVGGKFKKHQTGTFNTRVTDPSHSIMRGFEPFETWDETYVHEELANDIHILQARPESQPGGYGGEREEPWTWVRTEGDGRVFYTAYGHDGRTWAQEGFANLLERGIRWATRKDGRATVENPTLVGPSPDAKPFEYVTAQGIPFYSPDAKAYQADASWNKMPKPLSPDESIKHMILPEGFRAELFVAEPDIIKPLTMAWDERGRLWVVESLDYPNNVTDAGKGNDRIKICEDTDGDGRADRFSVFAENLNMPASILFANGGIIIPEHKSTWFLKDTDGDGKADVREQLHTGWYPSQMDTHAGPNNFRYGLDNWIWGMVGYGAFNGEVGGKSLRFQQGFHRFSPDGTSLEYLRSTSNNTWGIGFSDEGIAFGSTANGCPSVYLPVPNRYYEAVKGGWSPSVLKMISPDYLFSSPNPKVRQVDWHGGFTAAAGHALYTARVYPKEYWNRTAFVAEPTGHLVGTFVLEPFGADFKSNNRFNLLASMDEWTSPIMAEVGPDGFVWVIDWYAYIVQHNPTPQGYENGPGNAYVTPRRDDHQHGRIYRIVYENAKPAEMLDLARASNSQLVETLRNDNLLWRSHAQRLLVEKNDPSVVPALVALVRDESMDEIGLNVGAIHALWTLHGMGALDGSNSEALTAAVEALRHPSAGVRRNAVQVLPAGDSTLKKLLDSKLIEDPDPQVRLMSFLAIADQPGGGEQSARAGQLVFDALERIENVTDRWIPDAAVAAAAKHNSGFLNEALAESADASAQPTPVAAATAEPSPPRNLLANGSFEQLSGEAPAQWLTKTYSGEAVFAVDEQGRSGRAVKISSEVGADASWSQDVAVKPNTRYRLSAWVKTDAVAGDAMGGLFNIHEFRKQGTPTPLKGTTDWTLLTGEVSTSDQTRVTVNMLLGGWGRSTGRVWFDDVQLIELGPSTPTSLASAGSARDKLAGVVHLVARHYASYAPSDSILKTLAAVAQADPQLAEGVLDGLVAGWPAEQSAAPKLTDDERRQIATLGQRMPAAQRNRLLVLATRWGEQSIFAGLVEEALKSLRVTLASASAAPDDRINAARRMIDLRDDKATLNAIIAQITPQSSAAFLDPLIQSIAQSALEEAGTQLLLRWRAYPPAARSAAVSVLLRKAPWTIALLKAVEEKKVGRGDLTASDWQTLKAHRNPDIAALARTLDAAQTDPDRVKVLEAMLPALEKPGDIQAGHKLFQQLCTQCHAFNGEGGKLGPELTGIGTRDPKELLAEIVDPNRSVEANYRVWDIETKKREYIAGRLDTETQTTVELLDATGKRHVIERKDIQSMTTGNMSVMPVGLIDHLQHDDIASLMAYLKSGHPPGH